MSNQMNLSIAGNTNLRISNLKSSEKALKDVNTEFDNLLQLNVCLICDSFVFPSEADYISVDKLLDDQFKDNLLRSESIERAGQSDTRFEPLPEAVQTYYTYRGTSFGRPITRKERNEIRSMLLSPRGTYRHSEVETQTGLLICKSCHRGVKTKRMPKYAIANNFYFGTPPSCLLELSEVELALITPMRTFGYCFSYTGGRKTQLRGSLMYYRIDIEKIVATTAQFDVLGLTNNVVVLLHGSLTEDQAKRVIEKSTIRTKKVLKAVAWLIKNHIEWKTVNYRTMKKKLKKRQMAPEVLKKFRSTENGESDEDIMEEKKESFEVFYPDGSSNCTESALKESFTNLLANAQKKGYAVAMRKNLVPASRVSEFHESNLINSCLLQFPYGIGGYRAKRFNGDSCTGIMDAREYAKHLSFISQPHFHHGLFQLRLYNFKCKQDMFLSASYCVRGNLGAESLLAKLSVNDLEKSIDGRIRGNANAGSRTASQYLNIIDSVNRAVPHTDEAAKRARQVAEAHMHEYGLPTFFLTACPDDDNNIVIQIMSQQQVDDNKPISTVSDEVLLERSKGRTSLRLKFPGICCLYFRYALIIILKQVVGWDLNKNRKTNDSGVFGETIAIAGSVEEQGRGTLHFHLQVWVKEFINAADKIHSKFEGVARSSSSFIAVTMDKLASATLFDAKKCPYRRGSYGIFDHPCHEPSCTVREAPEVVDDQQLRYLRHRRGQVACNHLFAKCPNCTHTWTNAELVRSYLEYALKTFNVKSFPDAAKRLKAILIQYQKGNITGDDLELMPLVVDAAYNHHMHTTSCFACKAEKSNKNAPEKKRKRGEEGREECRYRFPTCPSPITRIRNLSDFDTRWYNWDGTFGLRQVKEIVLKRHRYDAFQNPCCRAISHSKFSCNSNLQFVAPGPLAVYTFWYSFKGTQKDDTSRFDLVISSVRKFLARAEIELKALGESSSPRSLAIGMVLGSCHAHQKDHVTSPYLASYILRYDSRFIFSHEAVWCPLFDIESMLLGGKAFTTLRHVNKEPIFNNAAMHYLCRPIELSNVNAFDFYSKFDVVDSSGRRTTNRQVYEFSNEVFAHPSYSDSSKGMLQCIVESTQRKLIRIPQYSFPDTASFNGSILSASSPANEDMIQYAKMALLLFKPFRTHNDLICSGSYVSTFRLFASTSLFTSQAKQWLQNVQDCRANTFRLSKVEDELQQTTKIYSENNEEPEQPDLESENERIHNLDDFLELFGENVECDIESPPNEYSSLTTFNLENIRNKGKDDCGWVNLGSITVSTQAQQLWECVTANNNILGSTDVLDSAPLQQNSPDVVELGTLLLQRVDRLSRTFAEISNSRDNVSVLEANGSALSIVDWGRKARLDEFQQRAFEVIVSTFILTFHNECSTNAEMPGFLREENERLHILSGTSKRESEQLICLLHGPGGSGKTTIVNLLLLYAKEFCGYLGYYNFHENTIVVTAMSGVAATHILGETTHSAVHLYKSARITPQHVERWDDTRLLIIDEISFASKEQIEQLNGNLNRLLSGNKHFRGFKYHGMHMVFSGDFCQLEPVKSKSGPLYKTPCEEFNDWINCFIELNGMHRFDADPEYGRFLYRMRLGEMTPQDVVWINERVVVKGKTRNGDIVPPDVKFCTHDNSDRDAINAGIFFKRCKSQYDRNGNVDDSLIVFCSDIEAKNDSKVFQPFPNHKALHENCSESDIDVTSYRVGRIDPALKLYYDGPVMLPYNENVSQGLANGTQGTVKRIKLLPGTIPRTILLDGCIPIKSVDASEVVSIEVQHSNERIHPTQFLVSPKQVTFKANLPDPHFAANPSKVEVTMKATQVPLIVNNATTGHKLQGSGVRALFVNGWDYRQKNWAYVVLSRVTTKRGLFLRLPLVWKAGRFERPEGLQAMLASFSLRTPSEVSSADYESFRSVGRDEGFND
jgi:AAA domain/Helitron helicase-like domain at N-terminus